MLAGLIAATATLAHAQPSPAPPQLQRVESMRTLNIPDEIGPAIAPYVMCMMARQGIEQRASLGGPVVRPAVPVGADCTPHRAQAARRAEEMLRAQDRGTLPERRAFVERVLVNVEGFAAGAGQPSTQLPNRDADAQNR